MPEQHAIAGFPFAAYLNETDANQRMTPAGVYLNETTPPPSADTQPIFIEIIG